MQNTLDALFPSSYSGEANLQNFVSKWVSELYVKKNLIWEGYKTTISAFPFLIKCLGRK